MTTTHSLPDGAVLVRTTDQFDQDSVPAGLLRSHQVARGVWGRLVVRSGSLGLLFEDEPDQLITVEAGSSLVIPPATPHRVVLQEPATFVVEFYRDGSA